MGIEWLPIVLFVLMLVVFIIYKNRHIFAWEKIHNRKANINSVVLFARGFLLRMGMGSIGFALYICSTTNSETLKCLLQSEYTL